MPNIVVVGAQWGDEAKGKVVDYLASRAGMVVRYGGGSNAGHTVTVEGETFKFHLVPSGILHRNVTCVIADGVVVDPAVLCNEVRELGAKGCPIGNLRISSRAHVIMPYHRRLDRLDEAGRGESAIGTTGRGIGPAYTDKAARVGIRMHEFVDPAIRDRRIRAQVAAKNELIVRMHGQEPLDAESVLCEYSEYAETLAGFVCDTSTIVSEACRGEAGVVFEGAQGTLLDLDIGTYPYVTSSHPVAGAACIGTGVGPTAIDAVVGVAKAYTTRVGAGAFPTELTDSTGDYIRERGHEYGTTTGRPRRCGWLDTVVLRFSAMQNGMTALVMGHLDVLSGLSTVRVATGYSSCGMVSDTMPCDLAHRTDLEPVYEDLPGWDEDVSDARAYDELPATCRAYVEHIEQLVGVPIAAVSVGPGRDQMIMLPGRSLSLSARRGSGLA